MNTVYLALLSTNLDDFPLGFYTTYDEAKAAALAAYNNPDADPALVRVEALSNRDKCQATGAAVVTFAANGKPYEWEALETDGDQ